MNRKNTLAFCLSLIAMVCLIGGCVGYAGSVDAAGNHKASSGGVMTPASAALNLGNVAIGHNDSQTVAVKNTGDATVILRSLTSSNRAFVASGPSFPQDLPAGQTVSFSVQFAPKAAGNASGTVTLGSNAINAPTKITVSGTGSNYYGGKLTPSPASVNLGSVAVGSTALQTVSISNQGDATAILSSLTSSSSDFRATGPSFPMDLPAGQSVVVQIAFTPTTSGAASGTVTLGSNSSDAPTVIGVSGTGTKSSTTAPGTLSVSPASASLGNVTVGTSASQTITVTNSGGAAVILSSLNSSSAAFTASGLSLPMNLGAGQSAAFKVAFSPQSVGSSSGTITVGSNASDAPTAIGVSGMGIAAVQAPSISQQPAAETVTVGQTATFTVTATANAALTYQWQKNGAAINGATSASYTTPATATSDSGSKFAVVVSDSAGSVTSSAAALTVNAAVQAPSISQQPAAQTVTAGQTATFTVTAAANAALTYQWQENGAAISGATGASYTTPATTASDSGSKFTVVVSDSAGSVTSSAATLTVNAAQSILLNSSTNTLSFGSVNVGSNSALSVTFTNGGNSNVTVSSVTVSGAGFNATGISTGQVVTPGNTATLNVTFAPGSGGSASGTVTVASNATNSPASVSLSGTGAAQTSSSGGAPTCGTNNDMTIHVPTDWATFVPPAKGQSYVDPTFGCTVTRVTDSSTEDWNGSVYLPINHGYATVSPFNATDSYLMLADGWARHFVTDLTGNTLVPIANMPEANDTWMLWDATNPNVFYYTNGNSLMEGTINGSSVTASTVHVFTEYASINFMDETDVSEDGEHVVIVGGDTSGSSPEDVFDYNFVANAKGAVYTTHCTASVDSPNNGCLHKLIQTPDNNIIIQFANDGTAAEQGNRLWTGALLTDSLNPTPTYLLPLQNATNHLDAGSDMEGNPVFIEIGNNATLAGETSPCPSGWGTDVRMIYNPASAVCLVDTLAQKHVSYRGNASQPWATISYFDMSSPSPEWFDNSSTYTAPTSANWYLYEDEITMVRVDANNNSQYIYRLARAYSRSDEDFFATPRAAMSRDGRYIAFGSNMAYAHTGCPSNSQTSTGCTDVYVIKVR